RAPRVSQGVETRLGHYVWYSSSARTRRPGRSPFRIGLYRYHSQFPEELVSAIRARIGFKFLNSLKLKTRPVSRLLLLAIAKRVRFPEVRQRPQRECRKMNAQSGGSFASERGDVRAIPWHHHFGNS